MRIKKNNAYIVARIREFYYIEDKIVKDCK